MLPQAVSVSVTDSESFDTNLVNRAFSKIKEEKRPRPRLASSAITLVYFGLLRHTVNFFQTVYTVEKLLVKFPTFNTLLALYYAIFSKNVHVFAILEEYFAYVVIALIYSKTTIRAFKS